MADDLIGATRHERIHESKIVAPAWKNPNAMQAKDYALLREAIRACGGTRLQPVLLRETAKPDIFEVVDGLHRVQACRDEAIEEVDAIVLARGTSNADAERVARLLQIGMNRMRGSLDLGAAADSVKALDLSGVDASLTALSGFDEASLRALLATSSGPSDEALLGGAAGSGNAGDEEAPADEDPTFELKVAFPSKKAMHAVRRAMREAGGGDLAAGATSIVTSYKASLKAQKKDQTDGQV